LLRVVVNRIEKELVPLDEKHDLATDSLANMFAMFVVRLLSACESGSTGGDACRMTEVLEAALRDTIRQPLGYPRFEHLLGLTLAILTHELYSWLSRGDEDFGAYLFKIMSEQWKEMFKMDEDELARRRISKPLKEYVDSSPLCRSPAQNDQGKARACGHGRIAHKLP